MRIGSLFSGIGGLELGLERAGLGHTVWQVEIDPRCRAVLAKHWPEVEQHDDVRTFTGSHVDLICGGFPCQDVSSAGKRAGLGGARSGLWYEYLRIVRELRPAWVVVENVASGASLWVDTVLTGLGKQGYACLPIPLAAADVGAPHERKRIFVVAYLDQGREPTRAVDAEVAGAQAAADVERETLRVQSGRGGGACGRETTEPTHNGKATADVDETRREGTWSNPHEGRARHAERGWRSPMPPMVRVVHGVSGRVDGGSSRARIAALGNSVVPACAEVIGHVIRELICKSE